MSKRNAEPRKRAVLKLAFAAGASAAALIAAGGAYAQEETDTIPTAQPAEEADDEFGRDEVVVTGSRIRRDAFTSTSPLQVIDSETIADLGLIDIQDVLQNTTVAQGVQLDQQFNSTFVSNAGPGGSAISLRSLGADRTLLLINGRRVAPGGVEGAPSFPDTSLLPSSIVQNIEILLDGASSIYGSDAVAGVVNVILRKEFEGLQLDAFRTAPFENSAGTEQRYSAMFGSTSDRGGFVAAAEYVHQEDQHLNDREWGLADVVGPDTFLLPNGGSRQLYGPVDFAPTNGVLVRQFGDGLDTQQFAAFPFGAVLLPRPGTANPAFGVFENFEAWTGDFDQLGGPGRLLAQEDQYLPEFQRFNAFITGHYDLSDWIEGSEVFAEFSLSNRQTSFTGGYTAFDIQVTADNPFSPFSPFGQTAPVTYRPWNPIRSVSEQELTQYRLMTGIRGNLGFVQLPEWDYEIYAGYTRSQGFSRRTGVDEVRFLQSLTYSTDALGNIICAPVLPNPSGPLASVESLQTCIPFNPFDTGLISLDGSKPQFTSQNDPRLQDWLIANRDITTFVDESIIGGYWTGPLLKLPAGDLSLALGGEARETSLDTRSSDVASRGLLSGFFLDRPSSGDVHLWELFGEIAIPLLKDQVLANSLVLEGSGRWTNHEFYGSNFTYSGKMNYMPTDFLTVRATVGSSFRAPGLRELFLEGQSGFQNVTDPCVVPGLAQIDTNMDGVTDTYAPGADADGDGIGDLDGRDLIVLANCSIEGINPFALGLGITPGTPEVFRAGNIGLDPETSFAWSAGLVFEQPWFESFKLNLSATYWDIKVKDSVLTPTAQFLVTSCYNSVNFPNDPFCTRRARSPIDSFLNEVDATPFNIARNDVEGFDFNMSFAKDASIGGEEFTFSLDTVTTLSTKISDETILPGSPSVEDIDDGEIGFPKWRSTATARAGWDKFTLFWQARHIGKQVEEVAGRPANCFNMATAVDFPRCYTVPHVVYHDASVSYSADNFVVRLGVNNVFDKAPPQVDEDVLNGTLDTLSTPIGVGYDRVGRRMFINLTGQF